MAEREIVKEYANDDLTVVWKPKLCIHAAECVKRLPQVYDPKAKPWVKPENANKEELIDQINACPSGALSYKVVNEEEDEISVETKIEVMPNGPVLIYGTLNVTHKDGSQEKKSKTTAFCRCGGSGNKPYCDGSHMRIEFKDE